MLKVTIKVDKYRGGGRATVKGEHNAQVLFIYNS